jgi:thiol-disulfide isomerase/thioredoxin
MKKILFCSVLILGLVACKKENATPENATTQNTEQKDSTTTAPKVALEELTIEKANTLVANKTNDTVYVTNFFATWCGPCMKEIPHFKEKMAELKDKPVKFTFISLDDKSDWNDKVVTFGEENQLSKNIVLLDGSTITPDFFAKNFKTWQGESIPFTLIKKGNMSDETVGSMSKEDLFAKLDKFLK